MGYLHCQISGFLMCIAINRYCYICHSLKYDRLFLQYQHPVLCGTGLGSHFAGHCAKPFCGVPAIWPLCVLLHLFPVRPCPAHHHFGDGPLLAHRYRQLLLPEDLGACHPGTAQGEAQLPPKMKPHDSRNLLTMFMVFVLFAVCWAPLNFTGFAVAVKPPLGSSIPEWLFTSSYSMAYFNSCLNVVIYGAMNYNFRKEYKRIMLTVFQLAYRADGG
ncbi:hypothetical protein QYF61_014832 [Mycteria americana]|uniref:G-protein coupled receptors family 1 profile domain-containing protein n=1 Tax=Mycteria americana TaxID=33587 RepID=A0AAN7MQS6_MYCAM|nr:hypothetical protein QYF61_014832 [Mycteria americana]